MLCLVCVSLLLFARLGHYDLWCDEADTALFSLGVAETGDMTAEIGHNLYALRQGSMLVDLKNRCTPPLPMYLVAPLLRIFGSDPFYVRLPFALCGLGSVLFCLYWLWRDRANLTTWWLAVLGTLGNASFFLYARQGRYYAFALLLTLMITYLYLHWDGRRRTLVGLMLASLLLLATHYLAYFALYVTLGVDYVVWQRRQNRLRWGDWLPLLVPQVLIGVALLSIYNPIGRMGVPDFPERNIMADRALLIWWNLRDLNACEYGVGLLILAAPLAYRWAQNPWLLRAPLAILAYVVAVSIASPQSVPQTSVADVRYLSPLIPACVFVTAASLRAITSRVGWLLPPLALLAFGTNLLNDPLEPGYWQSGPALLVDELIAPRTTSIMAVDAWLRDNVRPGASVWVVPEHQAYPLMYHSPQAVYGWQLADPPEEQFRGQPEIQFIYHKPVDWIIAFGGADREIQRVNAIFARQGIAYELAETLDVFYDDATRPELFWHAFSPITEFDKNSQAVYIYRRVSTPRPS